MTDISFTGSRAGPTPESEAAFRRLIAELHPMVFRHGACRGWDGAAVRIVRELSPECRIIAYPGRGKNDVGELRPDRDAQAIAMSDEVLAEDSHFARNRALVRDGAGLVACPPTIERQERGGTWYTIGVAAKVGKPTTIIGPKGQVI